MNSKHKKNGALALATLLLAAGFTAAAATPPAKLVVTTVPGMPAVTDSDNLYSETRADQILPAVKADLERVYVPNLRGNNVTVIDPATLKVVDRFRSEERRVGKEC